MLENQSATPKGLFCSAKRGAEPVSDVDIIVVDPALHDVGALLVFAHQRRLVVC